MDSEEQRLRQRIQEREADLKAKVELLKDRLEHIKRLADVKVLTRERPGLMVTGSVLTGFLVRRLTHRTNRHYHSNGFHYRDARAAAAPRSESASAKLWEPVIAILSAVATRAAIECIGEIGNKFVPWRRARRSEYDSRSRHG